MVVTFSHGGYVKSQPLADYRAQRRGGRGKHAAATKEDDFIERLFVAHSHDYLLCFSNRGRLYWLKVFEVPQGSRTSRGKPMVNMFPLEEGEKITAVVPVKEFDEKHYVFMATAQGTVKKTPLADFSRPRPSGIIAVDLDEGDYLVGVALTDGSYDVMLFSSEGKAVRFAEDEVRPMGRQAAGVRGMRLPEDGSERVVAMLVAKDESRAVLTATENGYGKRTPIAEYTKHGRGGQGMIAIQASERNGSLVGAVLVVDSDEVMLISTGGVLIRTEVAQIREQGRSTQGVTLIALGEGEKLAGVERIEEHDEDEGNGGNGNGGDGEMPVPERRGPPRPRCIDVPHLQFQRRAGDAAGRGARARRRRDARLARQRHGRDGDEPSRQGIHRHRRRGRARPARAARRSPRTTRCCSCRAARRCSSRRCR